MPKTNIQQTRISAVILTHNREQMLMQCLEALRAQTRHADEIIVIDNASTDGTRALLEKVAGTPDAAAMPDSNSQSPLPIRIVEGATDGSWAAARNLGVREATGDIIAFTDDDCLPDSHWLERMMKALETFDVVGGWVEPATPLDYPRWWHPEMGWAIGISVPGHKGPLAGSVYYPQTANWGARREILLREPFQEIEADFASDAHLYSAGREDAELWRRLRRNGYRTFFDPTMIVRHNIGAARFDFRTLLARAFQDGVALQRREPNREYLRFATDTIVSLPDHLAFGIWRGKEGLARNAAWELVWAVRQWGQWAEVMRREGRAKIMLLLLWMMSRQAWGKWIGSCKTIARKIGIIGIRLTKRSKKKMPPHPRSIVVAAAGYVGDMVLLHPFLSSLKMQRPEISITLITNTQGHELYSHDPAIGRIIVLEREFDAHMTDAIIETSLRSVRADIVLVPYFYHFSPKGLFSRKEAPVATFIEEVGFKRRWWYDLADRRFPKPVGHPEGENLFHLFSEAGLRGRLQHTSLAFLPDELNEASDFLRSQHLNEDNLVVIAPGSAKPNKLWEEERWGQIIQFLVQEYGLSVAILGSLHEEEMCRGIALSSKCSPAVWCDLNLRQVALILAGARLVVTTCNGMKHLAIAMETPTLTLYGPSDERQWGAIREPHRHGAVRGCTWDLSIEERVGLDENHQMKCISVEQLKRALVEMLGEH